MHTLHICSMQGKRNQSMISRNCPACWSLLELAGEIMIALVLFRFLHGWCSKIEILSGHGNILWTTRSLERATSHTKKLSIEDNKTNKTTSLAQSSEHNHLTILTVTLLGITRNQTASEQ
jgi:hypothetical protein